MKKTPFSRTFIVLIILLSMATLTAWLFSDTLSQSVNPPSKKYVQGSKEWLSLAIKSAPTEGKSAFELAQYFAKNSKTKDSVLWFKQAVRLNYEGSNIALASLYFTQKKFVLAQNILNLPQFPKGESYHLLAIKIALEVGDVDYIKSHYQQLSGFAEGQVLLKQLIKYQVIESQWPNLNNALSTPVSVCKNTIQFIATNLTDLAQSERLIKGVNKHALSSYFCFNPVLYQPINTLGCSTSELGLSAQAIQCDESLWGDKSLPTNTRYLAVLLPQGGANVHKGILYLDRSDSIDVFLHELTHLLGFVDEYALPEDHIACAQNQTQAWAYNIAVLSDRYEGNRENIRNDILKLIPWSKFIESDTPILRASQKGWLLGTPLAYSDKAGVFPSDTCDTSDKKSFKPLKKATMLTYNEVEFPGLYLDLLKGEPERYRMPSYHLNVAKALWLKGEEQEAKRWFALLQR